MVLMSTAPRKVSVIVPTCDRPALLRNALASIRALEGPDLRFEILLGDNGFASETRLIAKEFGAIHFKASIRGAGAARNVGLRAATGEYLAFLDDDDVWLPGNIRPHMALLDSHPELDAVIGQVVYTDMDLVPWSGPEPKNAVGEGNELLRRMLSGFFPQIGTTLTRIRVREEIGEFDEALIGGEDLDWLLRIARKHRLGFIASPSIFFRCRPLGSYDALQRKRVGYDRRVFLRHGLPEWRIWKSPLDFSKAYAGTLMHFYQYFVGAAVERAERGDRRGALRAIASAVSILPLHGAWHLVAPRPLRKALWASLIPWPQKSRPSKATLTS
jgi:glycosyltransferase involved in cell wall biosynthesis